MDAQAYVPSEEATFWERYARTRWGSYITAIERRTILHAHSLAGAPSLCVEVGCEGGRWSRLLHDRGWQLLCTDVNAESVATCRRRIPGATVVRVSPRATTIPCESGSAGLLLCIEVMPVIRTAWFIPEAARILKPGGVACIVLWNQASLRGFVSHVASTLRGKVDWYSQAYRPWRRRIEAAGFEVVQEEGFCWFPFTRGSNSRLVPLATGIEKMIGLRQVVPFSPWVAVVARRAERSLPRGG